MRTDERGRALPTSRREAALAALARSERARIPTAVALLLLLTGACGAQWPWDVRGPEPETVYPDVTVSTSRLSEEIEREEVLVLDARSRATYVEGHIPGAVCVPAFALPGPPATGDALGRLGISGEGRVVCYGDGVLSEEAPRLFWLLEAAGADDVAVLEGGLEAWLRSGGAVEAGERPNRSVAWARDARPDRWASPEHVMGAFGEKGFELVDVRGWDTWEGEPQDPGITPPRRTGHIHHALPYDFGEFLSSGGALRSPEDTRATFSRLGPRPSNPVSLQDEFIVYGEGGSADGAVGYYLLRRAGVARVSYYEGGFSEWSADPRRPLTRVVHAEEILARLNQEPRLLVPDAPPKAFVLLDVRHDRDYGIGHVPGAVNLQSHVFADSLDATIARHWPSADRASIPIVSYCYGPSCIRSRNCSTMAARAGFVNTERFYGGIEEWRGIGAPVIRTLGE